MMILVPGVLSPTHLAEVKDMLASGRFCAGRITAGALARTVKDNEQLDSDDPAHDPLRALIVDALAAHPEVRRAARPAAFGPVLFNRFGVGMEYGSHVDEPLMRSSTVRSDVSVTVFLSEPSSYDGGELVIDDAAGSRAFKGPAGSALLYPSTTLHRVAPVTRGLRLAAAAWIQSLVRDPARREILYDLECCQHSMVATGRREHVRSLHKSLSNLLRMWAEPWGPAAGRQTFASCRDHGQLDARLPSPEPAPEHPQERAMTPSDVDLAGSLEAGPRGLRSAESGADVGAGTAGTRCGT